MGVMTIGGIVHSSELGITAPHEHALIDISAQYTKGMDSNGYTEKVTMERLPELLYDPYALRDNLLLDDFEIAISEIGLFAAAGGRTFVDVTPPGIGRNIGFLKQLSKRTGLHVICATGFYTSDTVPHSFICKTEEELADHMTLELNSGIEGSGVCAGIIKIAVSAKITAFEKRALSAAASTSIKTGAPLMVHLNPWIGAGNEVLDILERQGLEAEKVALCHADVMLDIDYMKSLLDRGAYVEFDNFGKEFRIPARSFPTDRERLSVLYQLVDHGYLNKLLVSCDVCLKNLYTINGGGGYAHILKTIAAIIREERFDFDKIINALLISNNARYFENILLK